TAGRARTGPRAGGDLLPFPRRPDREGCFPGVEPGLHLPAGTSHLSLPRRRPGHDPYPEASRRIARGGRSQSPRAQCPPACMEADVSRRRRIRTGGGRPRGIVVAVVWLVLLLSSLSFVTW